MWFFLFFVCFISCSSCRNFAIQGGFPGHGLSSRRRGVVQLGWLLGSRDWRQQKFPPWRIHGQTGGRKRRWIWDLKRGDRARFAPWHVIDTSRNNSTDTWGSRPVERRFSSLLFSFFFFFLLTPAAAALWVRGIFNNVHEKPRGLTARRRLELVVLISVSAACDQSLSQLNLCDGPARSRIARLRATEDGHVSRFSL